ncbi:hypothetical protein OBBRIDRAFT_834207 [Obba rivulosa]|uniref:Uncharacterized protein n=1 Tax=Obba rivulosa TaxID=1052685 RepID=A0A8E2AUY3_9APHY|nr:hypothetical protein OBBRIDRAFT_834207 [Obba rivulosa]
MSPLRWPMNPATGEQEGTPLYYLMHHDHRKAHRYPTLQMSPCILFVYPSDASIQSWTFPDAARAYHALEPYATIEFASPDGLISRPDSAAMKDGEVSKFLNSETVTSKLANVKRASEVTTEGYDAVLYIGEHSQVINLPSSSITFDLASDSFRAGKITSRTPAGLPTRKSDFARRDKAAFSDADKPFSRMRKSLGSTHDFHLDLYTLT